MRLMKYMFLVERVGKKMFTRSAAFLLLLHVFCLQSLYFLQGEPEISVRRVFYTKPMKCLHANGLETDWKPASPPPSRYRFAKRAPGGQDVFFFHVNVLARYTGLLYREEICAM